MKTQTLTTLKVPKDKTQIILFGFLGAVLLAILPLTEFDIACAVIYFLSLVIAWVGSNL